MRYHWMGSLIVGLCALTSTADAQGKKGGPKKGWITSLTEGKTQAAQTGKPMMVVFRCDP